VSDDRLAALLAAGEHETFRGRPPDAVPVLEQAVLLARAQDQPAELAAAAWMLGVALAAGGRYGSALTVLTPLLDAADAPGALPERRLFGALAGSTAAGVHRQLGRHAVAREADLAALELAGPVVEARFDALLGLASDAVGLDDPTGAADRLAAARDLVPPAGGQWWRQRVRLGWTGAAVALAQGEPAAAAELARQAAELAEAAGASRHRAKALLVRGIAELGLDEGDPVGALREAATLAESLAALPLVWPSRALLAALVADSDADECRRSLAAARAAVLDVAADLPPRARSRWLARTEVAALLAG
jgi:tetratricopeptide (TPR) repeat protein